MAVNMNVIAEKIMKFIRGNGLQVQMFDDKNGRVLRTQLLHVISMLKTQTLWFFLMTALAK